ncbi:Actin-binding protein anillin [Strongyloides ratti]|uniref:Actin-binding protein anillin n=1 Tax=Strongyloides ratti TaxID=34506 RepID=A0A090LPF6_STRRB|nr:Actin-binding protein anillin [Strongyloides ratti]CEF69420.1 Actin-binding protein anillin [Strongyloides ratti]
MKNNQNLSKGQGDFGPIKNVDGKFSPNRDLQPPTCLLESSQESSEKSGDPSQKEIDDVIELLTASTNMCDNDLKSNDLKEDGQRDNKSIASAEDVHNDTAAKNARAIFLEYDRKTMINSQSTFSKPLNKYYLDYKCFTALPDKKTEKSNVKKDEICKLEKHNISRTFDEEATYFNRNTKCPTIFRSNAIPKLNENVMVPAKSTIDGARPLSSFMKNTPPATPGTRLNDDWLMFNPGKIKGNLDIKVNQNEDSLLFYKSPTEKEDLSVIVTPRSRPIKDRQRFSLGCNFDPSKTEVLNSPTQELSKRNNESVKRGKTPERIKTFTNKVKEDCIPGSTLLIKTHNNRELLHNASDFQKPFKEIDVTKHCFVPMKVTGNKLDDHNYSKSLPRELRNGTVDTLEAKRLSDSMHLEQRMNDENNTINFRTPKLTAFQRKFVDEYCAPKFSPAPRYLPDAPLGKILTTYKTETLSISSATGTLALRSAAQGIHEFTPIAHSTPFATPKHSFGLLKKKNESRTTILPNDDKSNNSQPSNSSRSKESFMSGASHVPSLNAPTYVTHISEEMYVRKLTKLKNLIKQANSVVNDAKKVVQEFAKKSNFNGTDSELLANRQILVGQIRIDSLRIEYERTKTLMNMNTSFPRVFPSLLSTYTLNDIKLELNRLFCFKKTQPDTSYAFCIVFKCANNVIGTQIKTVEDLGSVRLRQVKFCDVIKFSKLPTDFIAVVEVYAMKIGQRERTRLSRFKRSVKDFAVSVFKNSAKRPPLAPIDENGSINNNDSLHPSNQVCFDDFTLCGLLRLNRDTIGCQRFYLDEAKFPLEGTISLNTECSSLPQQIEMAYSGYLSVYNAEDFSREPLKLWTIVKRSIIKFWSNCEEEFQGKAPTSIIDMAKITSPKLEKIKEGEFGFKENSFYIDVLCEPSTTSYVYQQKRIYFTTECPMDCENWLKYLNEVIKLLRSGPEEQTGILS